MWILLCAYVFVTIRYDTARYDTQLAAHSPDSGVCRFLHVGLHPNGFSFEGTDTAGMDYALNRALGMFYSDRESWNELAAAVMQQDWSWDSPALDYLELYYKALKG
jgi:starch synthase